METVVRGMPLVYPPKPERLNAYGNRGRESGGRRVDQKAGEMETRDMEQLLRTLKRL